MPHFRYSRNAASTWRGTDDDEIPVAASFGQVALQMLAHDAVQDRPLRTAPAIDGSPGNLFLRGDGGDGHGNPRGRQAAGGRVGGRPAVGRGAGPPQAGARAMTTDRRAGSVPKWR